MAARGPTLPRETFHRSSFPLSSSAVAFEDCEAAAFALRCCCAEINVASAPSSRTRMQSDLGQIKPVVVCFLLAGATVWASEEER